MTKRLRTTTSWSTMKTCSTSRIPQQASKYSKVAKIIELDRRFLGVHQSSQFASTMTYCGLHIKTQDTSFNRPTLHGYRQCSLELPFRPSSPSFFFPLSNPPQPKNVQVRHDLHIITACTRCLSNLVSHLHSTLSSILFSLPFQAHVSPQSN